MPWSPPQVPLATPPPLSGPEPLSTWTSSADPTLVARCCIYPHLNEPHWPTVTF